LDLIKVQDELQALHTDIVCIGNGTVEQATPFLEEMKKHGYRGELYVDPSLNVYRAVHAPRSVWSTFKPSLSHFFGMMKARKQVNLKVTKAGDVLQQGALLVIGPGLSPSSTHYIHINRHSGEHANISDVLSAIRSIEPKQQNEPEQTVGTTNEIIA